MISDATIRRKQNELLKAAIDLFLERGFEGVSVDSIVEQVGGSKTTVYNYYGGKNGLFTAAIQKLSCEMLDPLWHMQVAHLSPREGLAALGKTFLEVLSCPRGIAFFHTVVAESRKFPEIAETFYAAGPMAFKSVLSQTIAGWQKQGLLRAGDPDLLTEQYLGVVLGGWNIRMLLGLSGPLSTEEISSMVGNGTDVFLEGAATL